MKMVSMWAMTESTESGDPKGCRFLKSNPSVADSGLMTVPVFAFGLNIPTTFGLMTLLLIGQEMVVQSEF
jgi:hypothetical protein